MTSSQTPKSGRTRMLRWLIPQSRWDYIFAVPMPLPGLAIYYVRAHVDVDAFIRDAGLGLLFILPHILCGCIFIALVVVPLFWAIISIALHEARKLGYAFPCIVLIGGLILSISIPID